MNAAGENLESVFSSAAMYVPVAPSLTVIPFAVSFTSESKPAPAMFTKLLLSAPVVTSMTSRSTILGLASSSTAVSSFPAPIALAKSSPVPAGSAASAAPVPRMPLAASETVPSPPSAATILAPPSAAARASRSRSVPDSETRISCGTRSRWSAVVTFPIRRPALPCPAAGLATTTRSGASAIGLCARDGGLPDDAGGGERLGLMGLEAKMAASASAKQRLGAGERRRGDSFPSRSAASDADERGLAGELDRGEQLVPRVEESEHLPLVEPLVGDELESW